MSKKYAEIRVRLPVPLHSQLKNEAKSQQRSMNFMAVEAIKKQLSRVQNDG